MIIEWYRKTGKCIFTYSFADENAPKVERVAYSKYGTYIYATYSNYWGLIWKCLSRKTRPIQIECNFFLSDCDTQLSLDNGQMKEVSISSNKIELLYDDECKEISCIAFLSNGNTLLTSEGSIIKEWDRITGKCKRKYHGHQYRISSLACHPSGRSFFAVDANGIIKQWDMSTGTCIRTFSNNTNNEYSINCITCKSFGDTFLCGTEDGTITEWDISTGKCLCVYLCHDYGVKSIDTIPNTIFFLSSSFESIKLWNKTTGQCILNIKKNGSEKIAVSPDGCSFVMWSGGNSFFTEYNLSTGQMLQKYVGHSSGINSVSYSPSGKILLSASKDRTIKEWNRETGKCMHTYHGHRGDVESISFVRDGKSFLSASTDGKILEWNILDTQFTCAYDEIFPGTPWVCRDTHSSWTVVSFAPDGRSFITGSSKGEIYEWKIGKKNYIRIFGRKTHNIQSSLNNSMEEGEIITVYHKDGSVSVKRINNRSESYIDDLTYSVDGKKILSADDGTICIWSTETKECLQEIKFYSGLIVLGCDMRDLHEGSEIDKEVLRQYGAIVD